jgi:endoglucanase
MRGSRLIAWALALAIVRVIAACGDDDGGSGGSAAAGGVGGGTGGAAGDSSAGSAGSSGGGAAGSSGGSAGSGGGSGGEGGLHPGAPPVSPFIVVDQFGYRTKSQKVAVARDPVTGFDAAESFAPGETYALVQASTGAQTLDGPVTAWNGGAEDPSSGDRAWRFDFSGIEAPGSYYVLDLENKVRSPVFRIADDVYRDVLKHAVRTFFYQRAGQVKSAAHAGAGWADGASHLGALQDSHCRRWSATGDASSEKDLSGGWYDAGDYNKYTNWHARYLITLLRAWSEAPAAFTDDYGIPESGNGIPDIVDEIKWGMDWLLAMQNSDGSVLSVMGVAHASPPSSATGPSYYGDASTSATLSAASAFAYGAKTLKSVPGLASYADSLAPRAQSAWSWAEANPSVTFFNNHAASGTSGLAAGQQEVDDFGRSMKKLEAAVYLFDLTGNTSYRSYVDASYSQAHLIAWSYAYPFESDEQEMLLHYASLASATPSVAASIRSNYRAAMDGADNFAALQADRDPYRAFIKDYTWGSNRTKSNQGSMYFDLISFSLENVVQADAENAAERFIHYMHGVNPLGIVYLTNMAGSYAEKSVNEIYHGWFEHGSAAWDSVASSAYGPPPGFVPGGPNPSYSEDGCCPSSCGSAQNNAICSSEPLSPPKAQPAQKSYRDFNTSWPLNSWEVTEPSNGYQVAYIRLLSKFVH